MTSHRSKYFAAILHSDIDLISVPGSQWPLVTIIAAGSGTAHMVNGGVGDDNGGIGGDYALTTGGSFSNEFWIRRCKNERKFENLRELW